MGNETPSETSTILDMLLPALGDIDLVLLDIRFYSIDIIMALNGRRMNYSIFVRKNVIVKEELSNIYQAQKKVILHEYSIYREGKMNRDPVYLAFLMQIFDHRYDKYYDQCFATNAPEIDLNHITASYKFRWRIETMFKVQDECRIKRKNKDIRVRYFLFAYARLIESIWYLFYHEEFSDLYPHLLDSFLRSYKRLGTLIGDNIVL